MLVTVTIIGILAAVAIPSYDKYMARSRRSEAQQLLSAIASREAAYLLDSRQYTNVIGTTGLNVSTRALDLHSAAAPTSCSTAFYTVTIARDNDVAPPTFAVTAAALGTQVSDRRPEHRPYRRESAQGRRRPNLGW